MRKFAMAFATLALTGMTTVALADGDPEKGEKVFRKCKACHQLGPDASNRVGPVLNGIIGAPAGAAEGFSYSKAMQTRRDEGLIWTEENLAAYFEKPKDFLPGTKMSFAGLRKDDDREDVIAYLKTFE